jgi:hypothetical protein
MSPPVSIRACLPPCGRKYRSSLPIPGPVVIALTCYPTQVLRVDSVTRNSQAGFTGRYSEALQRDSCC